MVQLFRKRYTSAAEKFENYKNMLYIPTIQNIKTKLRLYIC